MASYGGMEEIITNHSVVGRVKLDSKNGAASWEATQAQKVFFSFSIS